MPVKQGVDESLRVQFSTKIYSSPLLESYSMTLQLLIALNSPKKTVTKTFKTFTNARRPGEKPKHNSTILCL